MTNDAATVISEWRQRARDRHNEQVAERMHDDECEWSEGFMMCHCAKRKREASGLTKLPTEDLYFPPPDCPNCDRDLEFDGDSFTCSRCHLAWHSSGEASTAHFTDDYGDISWCTEHQRRACMLPHDT